MKTSRNSHNKQSKQGVVNKPRPEIRDDLDSRENLELNDHGGHNKKEVHEGRKNEHNERRGTRQRK